jgi:hypothetical protein
MQDDGTGGHSRHVRRSMEQLLDVREQLENEIRELREIAHELRQCNIKLYNEHLHLKQERMKYRAKSAASPKLRTRNPMQSPPQSPVKQGSEA